MGCSGKGPTEPTGAEKGRRDTKIRSEACSKSKGIDSNRDGKPDLFEVSREGRLACRASDIDFDGAVDVVTFFDTNGLVRRREIDFDGNGVPHVVEHYKNGKISMREIDAAKLGRFDTWEMYDPNSGERSSRERDTNSDGLIDQYWSFQGTRITVRFDRNEDGVPDDEGALVWGEGFETAQAEKSAAAAQEAGGAEAPPAEEEQPAPAGEAKPAGDQP